LELKFEIRDSGIDGVLERIARKGGDTSVALKIIGERIVRQTDDRWTRNVDPDGRPWVLPKASSWRKKKSPLTLVESGHLRNSIRWQVDGNVLRVGTNLIYARIQHEGGKTKAHDIRPIEKKALAWPGGRHPVRVVHHPGSNIPSRRFLGIGRADSADIVEVLTDWLEC